MINIADLPAVRDQLERAAAALQEQGIAPAVDAAAAGAPGAYSVADLPAVKAQLPRESTRARVVEYARAPDASGPAVAGARPPALQGNSR
jgi:hypothetical protein